MRTVLAHHRKLSRVERSNFGHVARSTSTARAIGAHDHAASRGPLRSGGPNSLLVRAHASTMPAAW